MNKPSRTSNILDTISLNHEYVMPQTEEDFDPHGLADGHFKHGAGHSLKLLFEIPKLNLLFFKEKVDVDSRSDDKDFIISCWSSSNFKKIDSIKVQEHPPFVFVDLFNCFITSSGYGTLFVNRITKHLTLQRMKALKAYRGLLYQLIEMDEAGWFASYGYDVGSRRLFSIKVWDAFSLRQIIRIKVETETSINILYIKSLSCFAVAKETEISLFCCRNGKLKQRISIETYGKRICKQVYSDSLGIMFVILEVEREEEFQKHQVLAWNLKELSGVKRLIMSTEIKCKDPIVIWDRSCILGLSGRNTMTEYRWRMNGLRMETTKYSKEFNNSGDSLVHIGSNQLTQVGEKNKLKVWKY